MTLSELITAALDENPDDDAAHLATLVLARCRKADLFPLVVDEIDRHRRRTTARMERSVTIRRLGPLLEKSGGSISAAFAASEDDNRQRLLDLMRRTWALGNGERVEIGLATVDEIEQRIDMMRKKATGLLDSIRIYEQVRDELRRTGARCLNDLLDGRAAA